MKLLTIMGPSSHGQVVETKTFKVNSSKQGSASMPRGLSLYG